MANPQEAVPAGRFEARYLAFLETMTHLRPSLHRYCARMTGSIVDGEDLVQEVGHRHRDEDRRSRSSSGRCR